MTVMAIFMKSLQQPTPLQPCLFSYAPMRGPPRSYSLVGIPFPFMNTCKNLSKIFLLPFETKLYYVHLYSLETHQIDENKNEK